jgi:AcrR family transcriptional regulator
VFAEVGYHRAGVNRITKLAECSRAAFYQYFSSKEDVFRHLAGQVGRQLTASAEALEPITPDQAGWDALRAWIDRHAAIYERYEPVFRVFQAAAESDEAVATGAADVGARDVAIAHAKLAGTTLPNRHVTDVMALLLNVMSWAPRLAQMLRAALPAGSLPEERVTLALTDMAHRTLFGRQDGVNVHRPEGRLPRVPEGGELLERLQADAAPKESTPAGVPTVELMVETARDVLVQRGYHATRVDDITDAAGISHGTFYRYFENKDHIVRLVTVRALKQINEAFDDVPDVPAATGAGTTTGGAAIRQWLRRYRATQASEAVMLRVWADAIADDPLLAMESSAAIDWGRQRLVKFLESRGFGDVEVDALLMMPLLDAVGGIRNVPAPIDAAALVLERGLLGTAQAG